MVSTKRILFAAVVLISAMFLACGDDDDDDEPTASPSPTSTVATQSAEPSATGQGTPTATEAPFEGARDRVEKDVPVVPPVAVQVDIRYAEHSDFDRVVFDFEENMPGYVIEYVEPPILADGSGNEVEIGGDAFLQIRFLAAQAHDEAGNSTIDQREIIPGLDSILELENTGDFEGQVTWVFGLPEELDFRVIELTDPTRVVVDVGRP